MNSDAHRHIILAKNQQIDNLYKRVDILSEKLYDIGICPRCLEERVHAIDEPFSFCSCGTAEDTGQPPLIQRLRNQITNVSK